MSLKSLITGLFVVGLSLLISCNKDKEEPVPDSTMTINGNVVDIGNAYLLDFGTTDCTNCKDYDIILTTENLTLSSSGITGDGDFVRLDLNSSSLDELASGTYSWSLSRIPESIVGAEARTTCTIECNDTECILLCSFEDVGVAGTVTIEKVGENFRVDFDISLLGGTKAIGTYFGTFEEIQGSV